MKAVSEHSAGGVVYRKFRIPCPQRLRRRRCGRENSEFRIKWLICKHSGYHKWVLPKGIIETGESPEEAALREVAEETGIKAKIIGKIMPEVAYKYIKNGILVDKKVEFFLMEYASGDIKDHCWEMEEIKWVTAEGAIRLLAFETEKMVLKTAMVLV